MNESNIDKANFTYIYSGFSKDPDIIWLNAGVCLENGHKLWTSLARNIMSKASKPSAGARWLRPAIGWPVSANKHSCLHSC